MRFIHTADIHLGATPDANMRWGEERPREIWDTFKKLIQQVQEEKPDLFIIAGDLFHRQPLQRELREVDYMFSTLAPTKVVLIAGNHDYISVDSYYNGFTWSSNVIFLSAPFINKVSIPEINTQVYGMSYHDKMLKEPVYDEITPADPDVINILVAHGGENMHAPMNKRKMLMSGFDYIACGHIHMPELHCSGKMAFSGSLEPIDKNDVGPRGFIRGQVTKQECNIEFVPFAKRTYQVIELETNADTTNAEAIDKVKAVILNNGPENIYKIQIKGYRSPEIVFDKDEFFTLGNVIQVVDLTEPNYDFYVLYENNKDNMIGMFIKKFGEESELDEVHKKALYYGTKALLDATEDR